MLHTLLISISLLLRLTAQNSDDCSTVLIYNATNSLNSASSY
ncbi:MAG: hypothetical protein RI955_1933 [Bacteroidota bacterium]